MMFVRLIRHNCHPVDAGKVAGEADLEAMAGGKACYRLPLPRTDLDECRTARSQHAPEAGKDDPHRAKSVLSAVKPDSRIMRTNLDVELLNCGAGNVRRVCHDDVEARLSDGRGPVAHEEG